MENLLIFQIDENATNSTGIENSTARFNATTEGMAVAYSSLLLMTLFPIAFGSFWSVSHVFSATKSKDIETLSGKDAMLFPLYASGALFSIYLVFRFLNKEYVNFLLAMYFFVIGSIALTRLIAPLLRRALCLPIDNLLYSLLLYEQAADSSSENTDNSQSSKNIVFDVKFDYFDVIAFVISGGFGMWYLLKKHWIANNIFGLTFAVSGVELLHLNALSTGCILLGGLFFYDIFWVFATDVMVTVAKSFDGPIKLIFPQDLLENGWNANNFAMLGLGDIVVPGIFIALLLRYDHSRKHGNPYFYAGFVAYVFGLALTIFVMHTYKHAQPALLYLVPCCIGFPLFLALIKGDIKSIFSYRDNPDETKKTD